MLIPEASWTPSFASCRGVCRNWRPRIPRCKILGYQEKRNQYAASIRSRFYPENDPWSGKWEIAVGDTFNGESYTATAKRRIAAAVSQAIYLNFDRRPTSCFADTKTPRGERGRSFPSR